MIEIFQKYMGTGLMLIWFILALVYLFLKERRKPLRILFIYTPVIVLLLFFNPLFYKLFYAAVGDEIYFRLCWLLPVTVVVGYAAVLLYDSLEGAKRNCFILLAAIFLMGSGKLVYSSPLYSRAENNYHVPQAVVDICDAIEIEGREVRAVFPEEMLLYVRQYSPVVCMPYGRNVILGEYHELHRTLLAPVVDAETLARQVREYDCHYVVLSKETILQGDLTDYDYEIFEEMHGYVIYKNPSMNFEVP